MNQAKNRRLSAFFWVLAFCCLLTSVYWIASPNAAGGGNSFLGAAADAANPSCSLTSLVIGHTQYVENCYYIVGVSTVNGVVNFTSIRQGSNQSIVNVNATQGAGLLTEELDAGIGGYEHFTSANVSVNAATSSYLELGVSGRILSSPPILLGTLNMTFFANEPYIVASYNSTIEEVGTHLGHDFANFVSSSWNQAWAGPGNNGTTEVCTNLGCTHYAQPENTFDTSPDIKSLIQRNGPSWGWLGSSPSPTSAEGVGFLLLGYNSTDPNEQAISHYEINWGDWEIEGTGVNPSDRTSNQLAPHALQYTSAAPQKQYGAVLVYLNAAPYTTFESFVQNYWKYTTVGSYLASSLLYSAYTETGTYPNGHLYPWYLSNIATTVSAPQASFHDGMLYFTGRNSSLANDFPLKMFLNLNGSTAVDSNFETPNTTIIANDGTNAKLEVVWNDTTDGLGLVTTFSTKSNSDKINVTGYVEVTATKLSIQSLSWQEQLFQNLLDGTGWPSQYSSSASKLSWNYTTVGTALSLPSGNGFVGEAANRTGGSLYLVNSGTPQTYHQGTLFNFQFAASFYSPLSNWTPAYTENIYAPKLTVYTQPLGNASQVGFAEDGSRLFSYLLNAMQFDSNRTIASIQLAKPFSGNLAICYTGAMNSSVYAHFSNGTTEPVSHFYDRGTGVVDLHVSPVTSATLYVQPSASGSTNSTEPAGGCATSSSSNSTTSSTSHSSSSSTTSSTSSPSTSTSTTAHGAAFPALYEIAAAVVIVAVAAAGSFYVLRRRQRGY